MAHRRTGAQGPEGDLQVNNTSDSLAQLAAVIESRQAGDPETVRACEQIIEQEKAMSAWLLNRLPTLTQDFLARDASPHTEAKV